MEKNSTNTNTTRKFAELLLCISVLIWAGNYSVCKLGIKEFSPLSYTTLRFLIATPIIYLLLKWREGSLAFPTTELPRTIAVGVAGISLYQTTFMLALKYSSVTITALGFGLSPVFTVLLSALFGQEKLRSSVLAGCFIAFFGLFLALQFGQVDADLLTASLLGDALSLLAGFLWGLYPILAAPLLKKHSGFWVAGHTSLFGTIFLLLVTLPELIALDWQHISPVGWSSLLYSAIPNTVIAMVALYYGIDKIGTNQAMIYMYLVCPVAIIISMLTLGETVTLLQGTGILVTIGGVVLAKSSAAKYRQATESK